MLHGITYMWDLKNKHMYIQTETDSLKEKTNFWLPK